jgi:acyl-CoA dehydrogenase
VETLAERIDGIGSQVAEEFADAVDREARFPAETMAELRRSGVLGALVPTELGGPGLTVSEVAEAVSTLASHCGSSGLILAMHSIQVACLVRHAPQETLDLIVPGLLSGDLLLANAASEIGLYGERRSSICALEQTPTGFRLEKRGSTISYGEYADGILATARRTPESPPNEQVFAICMRPNMTLEPLGDWDTLGMRGTCSRAGLLKADLVPELVLEDYADIFVRTSLSASAVLLGSVWLGLAEGAARKAHDIVRKKGRKLVAAGPLTEAPLSAVRLAELGVYLHQLRCVVAAGAAYNERAQELDELNELSFSSHMDNLKISSSTLVLEVVQRAMQICGMGGYQNATETSLGRIARDAAAAPLMVSNDRTLDAMARALLVRKEL